VEIGVTTLRVCINS